MPIEQLKKANLVSYLSTLEFRFLVLRLSLGVPLVSVYLLTDLLAEVYELVAKKDNEVNRVFVLKRTNICYIF